MENMSLDEYFDSINGMMVTSPLGLVTLKSGTFRGSWRVWYEEGESNHYIYDAGFSGDEFERLMSIVADRSL